MTKMVYLKRIISASLIISLMITFTACSNNKKNAELSSNTNTQSQQQTAPANNAAQPNTSENNTSNTTKAEIQDPSLPKFNKIEITANPKFSTPWKTYNSVKACIDGKGETASEEGIGKVIVKDSSGKMYSYEIADNKKQDSPKYVEWWDDKNLLIVIGLGYGTISQGGSLYSLNIETGKLSLVYKVNDKQNVVAVTKVKNKDSNYDLYIKMLVFEDDNYTKSHYEEFTKPYSQLTMLK